jgi:HAD superfamily hydrolase (TIGR01484 family)
MNMQNIKLIAFDLDGTLTQHKSKLSEENQKELLRLSQKYKLIMVGAGQCRRIFEQMNRFPIDIIGNYGMQYARYDKGLKDIAMVRDDSVAVSNKEEIEQKVTALRKKHGFTEFKGDNVEYHPSGCLTFPILGTKADINDKLAFDPDRTKRRAFYSEVVEAFPDYVVFVGGSSSFDMAPKPYNKYYALDLYCKEHGLNHDEVVFVGDDYGIGGNDESVYKSDFKFICVDNYLELEDALSELL